MGTHICSNLSTKKRIQLLTSSSKALDPTTAIEVENILYPAHNDDDVAKYEQAQVRSIEAAGDETHNACEFPADSSPEENSYVFLRCYCLC